jgi:hypothetical protein
MRWVVQTEIERKQQLVRHHRQAEHLGSEHLSSGGQTGSESRDAQRMRDGATRDGQDIRCYRFHETPTKSLSAAVGLAQALMRDEN